NLPRGLYLAGSGATVQTDHQLTTGLLGGGLVFEIERGKIVRRIGGGRLAFRTLPLWKSLQILGGESTRQSWIGWQSKGQPWSSALLGVTAPAALFPTVDFIHLGRM